MAFVERKISVTIALATDTQSNQPNSFAGTGGKNTVTLTDLRMSVRIQNSGTPVNCNADVQIWGLAPSMTNQIATLGLVLNLVPKNTVTIAAGDRDPLSAVFTGTIVAAYGDYSAQPDVPFHLSCVAGMADAVLPAVASSFTGSTSVVSIMQGLARQMNMGFENNGISVQLQSPYFSGSLMEQTRSCAEHANIDMAFVDGPTLAIYPKGGNRNTSNVPVISKANGKLIGYPAFTQQGIIVKSIFDPTISRGSLIKVESELLAGIAAAQKSPGKAAPNANLFPTNWAVNKLDLALDAKVPKGDWMSTIYGYNPGYAKSILPPP